MDPALGVGLYMKDYIFISKQDGRVSRLVFLSFLQFLQRTIFPTLFIPFCFRGGGNGGRQNIGMAGTGVKRTRWLRLAAQHVVFGGFLFATCLLGVICMRVVLVVRC